MFLAHHGKSNYFINWDDDTQLSSKTTYNKNNDDDDAAAAIDRLSQLNTHQNDEQTWVADAGSARTARLQASDVVDDVEYSKRRNDALFLGKFLMNIIIVSFAKPISKDHTGRGVGQICLRIMNRKKTSFSNLHFL